MANDWILDVIEDLRRFAELNELPQLASALDLSACVATRELEQNRQYMPMGATSNAGIGGSVSGRIAAGQDA